MEGLLSNVSPHNVPPEETFMPIATNLPKLRDLDVGWAMGVCNQYLSTLLRLDSHLLHFDIPCTLVYIHFNL